MATLEKNALVSYIDDSSNRVLVYPITKSECVDGLEEEIAKHSDRNDNPHNVTASQVSYDDEKSVKSVLEDLTTKVSRPPFTLEGETLILS